MAVKPQPGRMSGFWKKVGDDIAAQFDALFDRKTVVGSAAGTVTVLSDAGHERAIVKIKGASITPGDDVVVIKFGDGEIALGALTIPGEDESDGSQYLPRSWRVAKRMPLSELTSSGSVYEPLSDFALNLGVSEAWIVHYTLRTTCTGTGGIKFACTGPTGLTGRLTMWGDGDGPTDYQSSVVTGTSTLSAAFNTGAFSGHVNIVATLYTDATNAGQFVMNFVSGTDTELTIVNANSAMVADRTV